jgi:hypothetical protein
MNAPRYSWLDVLIWLLAIGVLIPLIWRLAESILFVLET